MDHELAWMTTKELIELENRAHEDVERCLIELRRRFEAGELDDDDTENRRCHSDMAHQSAHRQFVLLRPTEPAKLR